jgi:hypothetical protein
MKGRVNRMKKTLPLRFSIIVVVLCFVSITVTSFARFGVSAENQVDNSGDISILIDDYIQGMANQEYDSVLNLVVTDDIGYDALNYNYLAMMNSRENPEEWNQIVSASPELLVSNQADFIKYSFGEDAWENVTYHIEKWNCPSKKEVFVHTETNEILSEVEANRISEEYWQEFAFQRGISYDDFVSIIPSHGRFFETDKLNILQAKELGFQPPIRVDLADEYDYYLVFLEFNNRNQTSDGENLFLLTIDNRTGPYSIVVGLRWSVHLPDFGT